MVGIDKAPPRLYHRTLKDAAFSILENGMIAGSGKLHSYFAEETLDELGTKAGVRAGHPIEVVMDTSLVAAQSAGCSRPDPRASALATQSQDLPSSTSGTHALMRCSTPHRPTT